MSRIKNGLHGIQWVAVNTRSQSTHRADHIDRMRGCYIDGDLLGPEPDAAGGKQKPTHKKGFISEGMTHSAPRKAWSSQVGLEGLYLMFPYLNRFNTTSTRSQ